jgi:hypothetical protein
MGNPTLPRNHEQSISVSDLKSSINDDASANYKPT